MTIDLNLGADQAAELLAHAAGAELALWVLAAGVWVLAIIRVVGNVLAGRSRRRRHAELDARFERDRPHPRRAAR